VTENDEVAAERTQCCFGNGGSAPNRAKFRADSVFASQGGKAPSDSQDFLFLGALLPESDSLGCSPATRQGAFRRAAREAMYGMDAD
jgi:hypothetical protein